MDSLTHVALGAVVGFAVGGRRFGRAGMLAGVIANTIPDLDVFAPGPAWESHRALTHSLFFGPVVGPALGWLTWRLSRWRWPDTPAGAPDALGRWITLFVVNLMIHPLLDFFTIYGTQLLAPFSNARFSLSGIGIIDPIYTLPIIVAALIAVIAPRRRFSKLAAWLLLWLTTAYLFYGVALNARVEAMARDQLREEGVPVAGVRVYTTIFQPWLRRIVVDEPAGGRVAFATPLQHGAIAWECFKRAEDPRIATLQNTPEGMLLAWFADGDLWPEVASQSSGGATVRLLDRRYGVPGETVSGWWGVEGHFGSDGQIGPVRQFNLPRDFSGGDIAQLLRASLGAPTTLFPQAPDAAAAAAACTQGRRGPT